MRPRDRGPGSLSLPCSMPCCWRQNGGGRERHRPGSEPQIEWRVRAATVVRRMPAGGGVAAISLGLAGAEVTRQGPHTLVSRSARSTRGVTMDVMRVPMLTEGHHAAPLPIERIAAMKRHKAREQGDREQKNGGDPGHVARRSLLQIQGLTNPILRASALEDSQHGRGAAPGTRLRRRTRAARLLPPRCGGARVGSSTQVPGSRR